MPPQYIPPDRVPFTGLGAPVSCDWSRAYRGDGSGTWLLTDGDTGWLCEDCQ